MEREGFRNFGVIPADAQWTIFGDQIVVVHPSRPPFAIDTNTAERRMIEMQAGQYIVHMVGATPVTGMVTASVTPAPMNNPYTKVGRPPVSELDAHLLQSPKGPL